MNQERAQFHDDEEEDDYGAHSMSDDGEDSSFLDEHFESPVPPTRKPPPPSISIEKLCRVSEFAHPTALWTATQINNFLNNKIEKLIDKVNTNRIKSKYKHTNNTNPNPLLPLTAHNLRTVSDPRAYWTLTEINSFVDNESDKMIVHLKALRKKLTLVGDSYPSQSISVEMSETKKDEFHAAITALKQLFIEAAQIDDLQDEFEFSESPAPTPISLENIRRSGYKPTAIWTETQINNFLNNKIEELIGKVNQYRIKSKYHHTNNTNPKPLLPLTSHNLRTVSDPRAYWTLAEINSFVDSESDEMIELLNILRKRLIVAIKSDPSQIREFEVECAITTLEQLSIQDQFLTNQT